MEQGSGYTLQWFKPASSNIFDINKANNYSAEILAAFSWLV